MEAAAAARRLFSGCVLVGYVQTVVQVDSVVVCRTRSLVGLSVEMLLVSLFVSML